MNTKMNILKAIGIVLVVVGHANGKMFSWFIPYSFHMALFVFISGYFYKNHYDNTILLFLKKKFKQLVIPYYKWNLFYGCLITLLLYLGAVKFGKPINLETFFITPWKSGHQYLFNLAGWFVLCLFLIQISYILLRKIFLNVSNNEIVLFIIFLLIGVLGTYLATFENSKSYYYVIRVLFGLPFFHLGYIYKLKLEKLDRFNTITFVILLIYQTIIIQYYDGLHYEMVWAKFGGHILMPFLASFSGIWLFIHLADLIDSKLSNDKLLSYIGQNSYSIMIHHIFIFWLLNLSFYFMNRFGIFTFFNLPEFATDLFKSDVYYKYGYPLTYLLYVLLGIFVPIGLKYSFDKIKHSRKKVA
jgi:fucose 4-O-acetylase-like acetyltransferase